MSTNTDEEIDLQRVYTEEERDALFDAYIEAIDNDDEEAIDRILKQMPMHPRWARIVRDVFGADYLRQHFNITEAEKAFGADWLDGH